MTQAAFARPELDVGEHVVVHVRVVGELRFREHGEAHVAQRLHPRPDDVGAARRHVGEDGGLRLRFRSGEQRFYERRIAFRFPLVLSGAAEVREWYDDEEQRFRISVEVGNARFGRLFGYRGWFHAEELPCSDVPRHVKPVREEQRE